MWWTSGMTNGALLIDQRSASASAAERDIHTWGRGRRVFVSSLIGGMTEERAAVRAAIAAVGATPVMFEEDLGAQDISAENAYLAGVRSSEIYVGLFGARYGIRMGGGNSATHAEFIEAEREGLRLCLFVTDEDSGEMDGAQRDLIAGARNLYTTSPWSGPADLGERVRRRLEDLASQELAPWVRVGRTIFRAEEIYTDGQTITIRADILSPAVHDELVRMRDSRTTASFAAPHDARPATVNALTTRTVANGRYEETLTLTAQERGGQRRPMRINNISAEEVTGRALSDGLFGTTELGDIATWAQYPIDPFAELRGLSLNDAVLRPVARLLFSERMISDGIAGRIDAFALGPAHQGARRLRASWTPPQIYSNVPDPTPESIEGTVIGL